MNLVFFKFLCNIFFKYLTRGRVQYVGDMFSVSLSKGVGVLVREDEETRLRVQISVSPLPPPLLHTHSSRRLAEYIPHRRTQMYTSIPR